MQRSLQQASSSSTVTQLPAQRESSRRHTALCDAAQVQGCLSCCRSLCEQGQHAGGVCSAAMLELQCKGRLLVQETATAMGAPTCHLVL